MKKSKTKIRTGEELNKAAKLDLPLTRAELAACFRCVPDTITAYVKEGMPCIYTGKVQRAAKGARPLFIYSKCLSWLERKCKVYA